jgi:hypothetical protein
MKELPLVEMVDACGTKVSGGGGGEGRGSKFNCDPRVAANIS